MLFVTLKGIKCKIGVQKIDHMVPMNLSDENWFQMTF